MSVTGVCQICEAASAKHTCSLCGNAVCDDHWADSAGACSQCAQGRQQ